MLSEVDIPGFDWDAPWTPGQVNYSMLPAPINKEANKKAKPAISDSE